MKKLLLLVAILFSTNTFAYMTYSVDKDEFKGKTYHYIMTDLVDPNKPLSFPYDKAQSALVVGCVENDYYYAYIYFTSVNLTDGKINDGYELFTLEVKAGGSFTNIFATQDFGSKTLDFNMTDSDKKKITRLMKSYDEVLIQFNHYQDGLRFYKYDTKGFKELFDKHCKYTQ